jgi:hypothetical protein
LRAAHEWPLNSKIKAINAKLMMMPFFFMTCLPVLKDEQHRNPGRLTHKTAGRLQKLTKAPPVHG